MRVWRWLTSVAALVLSACAVGPEPRAPAPQTLGVPDAWVAPMPAPGEVDLTRWWQAFGDATLTELVRDALAANTDIEAAGARVRQSRAALAASRGERWPSLTASASTSRRERSNLSAASGGSGTNAGTTATATTRADTVGIDAAYEVDLFGGVRRSVAAARADAEAQLRTLRSTQVSVAAETTLAYVDLRLAERRLAIARSALAAQEETLSIVGWRVQAGLVSTLDREQARQLRAQTAASLPNLERSVATARNRLATLLAVAPDSLVGRLGNPAAVPLAPAPRVDIPLEVLRRRPDVAAAEQSLVAELARVGVRRADLYPALRLSGSFGGSAESWNGAADAAVGSIVASLTAPIFEGGRLRAAVEQQEAAAAAALAAYRGALYAALEDTENALMAIDAAVRRERELQEAAAAAEAAAELARRQYQTGLIDFASLLEAERTLLSSDDASVSARADRATAAVQLFKALGGGWETAPEPSSIGR